MPTKDGLELADDGPSALPARLDRLIAFLDSYFGKVELVQPDDPAYDLNKPPTPPPADEEDYEPAPAVPESPTVVKDETEHSPPPDLVPAEEKEPAQTPTPEAGEERKKEQEEEAATAVRAPIIRVRLDTHVADVVVEDLTVTSAHEPLQRRVESIIKLALAIVTPLSGDEVAEARPAKRIVLEGVKEEEA